jgi:hypothetical protein
VITEDLVARYDRCLVNVVDVVDALSLAEVLVCDYAEGCGITLVCIITNTHTYEHVIHR